LRGMEAPLVIEFVDGSLIERDEAVAPRLPIVGNGPPGTRVVFADGWRINLPTDQIVDARVVGGRARVSFGGMRWATPDGASLAFDRVKDLWAPALLSPERGVRMTLDIARVAGVWQEGVALHGEAAAR
jgi:hypothetical protein